VADEIAALDGLAGQLATTGHGTLPFELICAALRTRPDIRKLKNGCKSGLEEPLKRPRQQSRRPQRIEPLG
jgi:hypothetical protein